jgi:hypothetical protein
MLVQIPYSLDELLASVQFVRRRAQAGSRWLTVLLRGDTDDVEHARAPRSADEFDAPFTAVAGKALGGGVNLPWNLALAGVVALSLLFTRLTLGVDGSLANAHHLIGALVLTVISISAAEVARAARYFNVPLGVALIGLPLVYDADAASAAYTVGAGIAIIALSLRRGAIRERYGAWKRWLA